MEHVYDMLIIGGGPAGYTAALYGARAGLDTLVIERMSVGGQMALTGTVDNYPGFADGIDGFTLGMQMQAGAERFGAKTEYAEVTAVDFVGRIKRVSTTSGDFAARTVVIATGANPRTLGLPGEHALTGRGVHYCAHCDGRFYRGKTVMVVGGGNSAVTDALYLARLAERVLLVHRRDALRASKVYHAPLMQAENIELVWNTEVAELIADGRVSGAVLRDTLTGETRHVEVDGIFVSIGRAPATELFRDILALDQTGYIMADESTRTAIDGVFVVGDVRTKALRQIATAVADGATAVHFAEEYLALTE